jgi:hypothetical protein
MIVSVCAADEIPQLGVAGSLAEIAADDGAIREAVGRSLPFLETAGVAWMEERSCISCHHVPFLLWTNHVAQAKGFNVDPQKLTAWEA